MHLSTRLVCSALISQKKEKGEEWRKPKEEATREADYLMFLRNERKNIFSPKYRNKKSIHFLTPTLSRTTNVIYSQSLPLASGNMRIGELRNTLS